MISPRINNFFRQLVIQEIEKNGGQPTYVDAYLAWKMKHDLNLLGISEDALKVLVTLKEGVTIETGYNIVD